MTANQRNGVPTMSTYATGANRRLDALVAVSRDAGATSAERALAASHAARMMSGLGIDYLSAYPLGLPVVDPYEGMSDVPREWDDWVGDAMTLANGGAR